MLDFVCPWGLDCTCRPMSATSSAVACEAANDDVEDSNNAIDDGLKDSTNADDDRTRLSG